MRLLTSVLLLLPTLASVSAAGAQTEPSLEEVVRLGRERRVMLDNRIQRYEATARERFSTYFEAAGLRKLLIRREIVSRIDWSRDTVRIELLGAREVQPVVRGAPQLPPPDLPGWLPTLAFDPVDSEMLLRLDSTVILHPLAPGGDGLYRFDLGSETTLRLPGGRELRLVELRVAPIRPDPRLITGSLWLETEGYAVVRAAFRMSPGGSERGVSVGAPELGAEIQVAIEYGLWDLQWWLPHTMLATGVGEIAGFRFPVDYERRYDEYSVTSLTRPADPMDQPERPCRPTTFTSVTISSGVPSDSIWTAAWDQATERVESPDTTARSERRCDRPFLVTRPPPGELLNSDWFAGDIYGDREGVLSDADRRRLEALGDAIAEGPWTLGTPSLELLPLDLLRYNRVEGLSAGVRGSLPLGRGELRASARLATSGEFGGSLGIARTAAGLTAEVAAYRTLHAAPIDSNPFSLTASVGTFLLGRDENDYFRGTGMRLLLSPPAERRQAWDARFFAERQEPVRARSQPSLRGWLDGGFAFRPNDPAEPVDQIGVTLRTRGTWGDDPRHLRATGTVELHAESGDRSFVRPFGKAEIRRPIGERFDLLFSGGAGTSIGESAPQHEWRIGGGATVRGHPAGARRGPDVGFARGEVRLGDPLLRVSLFGDLGWAGDWSAPNRSGSIAGVGVGVSLLDDFLRVDVARGGGDGGVRGYLRMGWGL
jgi:hypothetical protein